MRKYRHSGVHVKLEEVGVRTTRVHAIMHQPNCCFVEFAEWAHCITPCLVASNIDGFFVVDETPCLTTKVHWGVFVK